MVVPASYQYQSASGVSVYGSSPTANCASSHTTTAANNQSFFICDDPTSSVLFDGYIPDVKKRDSATWASHLLTLRTIPFQIGILFDFTDTPDYSGLTLIELDVFNCPSKGSQLEGVFLMGRTREGGKNRTLGVYNAAFYPTTCDYLMRYCFDLPRGATYEYPQIIVGFDQDWVYIGEVTFYAGWETCTRGPATPSTPQTPPDATCNTTTPDTTANTTATTPDSAISTGVYAKKCGFQVRTLAHGFVSPLYTI